MTDNYLHQLQKHYENYFNASGNKLKWPIDPHKKMNPDFYVLEFGPNSKHKLWTYCTVGMSLEGGDNLIELFVFSPKQDRTLVELMTLVSSFHRNDSLLDIHHTFNIGRPWLGDSKCDHGFISLPYLDGEDLELFSFKGEITHCYWLIPITKQERDYKTENGYEALEQLFENKNFNYLNPNRSSLL